MSEGPDGGRRPTPDALAEVEDKAEAQAYPDEPAPSPATGVPVRPSLDRHLPAADVERSTDADRSSDAEKSRDTDAEKSTDTDAKKSTDTDAEKSTDAERSTDADRSTNAERPSDTDVPTNAERPSDTDVPTDAERPTDTDVPTDAERPSDTDVPTDAERSTDADVSAADSDVPMGREVWPQIPADVTVELAERSETTLREADPVSTTSRSRWYETASAPPAPATIGSTTPTSSDHEGGDATAPEDAGSSRPTGEPMPASRLPGLVEDDGAGDRSAGNRPAEYGSPKYRSAGYDSPGHDSAGYDSRGYDSAGYDSRGYDSAGYDSRYDSPGYDSPGYDSPGYDSPGYDSSGYDSSGYDSSGYEAGPDPSGPDTGGARIVPVGGGWERVRRRHRRQTLTFLAGLLGVLAVGFVAWLTYSGAVSWPFGGKVTTVQSTCTRSKPLSPHQITLRVYNGSERSGLAASVSAQLKGFGFNVQETGNDPLEVKLRTPIELRHGDSGRLAALTTRAYLVGKVRDVHDDRQADTVDVVLGPKFTRVHTRREATKALAALTASLPVTCPAGVTPRPTASPAS